MDPLQVVERVLGPVRSWPLYILHTIFIEVPKKNTMLKYLSAFMYGHGIGFEVAWKCYHACNRHGKKTVIKEGMKKFYNAPTKLHNTHYYNMFQKKFMYINEDLNNYLFPILVPEWLCLNVADIEKTGTPYEKEGRFTVYSSCPIPDQQIENIGVQERTLIVVRGRCCYDEIEKCENVMQCAIDKIRARYMNLQNMCRAVILERINSQMTLVDELPLPPPIKAFLKEEEEEQQ
jgi:hypothetical protein